VSPLSFAYFSLRRQRKVGAAPHRGNANKPTRKQGKANASNKPKETRPPEAKQQAPTTPTAGRQKKINHST
jgi:hypothetical protein